MSDERTREAVLEDIKKNPNKHRHDYEPRGLMARLVFEFTRRAVLANDLTEDEQRELEGEMNIIALSIKSMMSVYDRARERQQGNR